VYPFAHLKSELLQFSFWQRYAMSKLANIQFSKMLAEHNPNIKCVSLHPGIVATNMAGPFMNAHPWLAWPLRWIIPMIGVPVQLGVHNQLWAATSADVRTGAYYSSLGIVLSDSKTDNPRAAHELWTWTKAQFDNLP
jgi:NAD(P)-dependent dehydrogenase (short-subunit alcohol dehydrogenase family)